MSTTQDEDIAIWVCPYGYSADVLEFVLGGAEPQAEGCPAHGEPYIKRCAKADCPSPIYHPSDLDANYHKPCRAKIPWADTRSGAAQALMEHDPFNSRLLGTKKRDYALDDLVRKRYFSGEVRPEPARSPHELTAEERQDLIVPPSGRLPMPRVRAVRAHNDVHAVENSNLSRYLLVAGEAIDKPPRRVVRGVLRFLRDRGQVVGRGADKGLEDAVTLLVKTAIIAAVITAFGVCGIRLALGA